jgi:hypothetical protein
MCGKNSARSFELCWNGRQASCAKRDFAILALGRLGVTPENNCRQVRPDNADASTLIYPETVRTRVRTRGAACRTAVPINQRWGSCDSAGTWLAKTKWYKMTALPEQGTRRYQLAAGYFEQAWPVASLVRCAGISFADRVGERAGGAHQHAQERAHTSLCMSRWMPPSSFALHLSVPPP